MREIGGYIELDRYAGPMLHEGAVALNCARSALKYLIRARGIEHIFLPLFLCDTVAEASGQEKVEITYYSINEDFLPEILELPDDAWLYVVNFYGQISNEQIARLGEKYKRLIVDNAQAYFQMPAPGIDTIYTCRKFFGVPDGAFLYTDAELGSELERDESFERMRHLLGRFERTASDFYQDSVANNRLFRQEPVKRMSLLTDNLLRAIDYDAARRIRTSNFAFLHEKLRGMNGLRLTVPEGAFMYPLYLENGAEIRKALQKQKMYIPVLWPNVLELDGCLEKRYAQDILPLPCDQRYGEDEMQMMVDAISALTK